MKKLFAVLIAAALMLSASGCGNKAKDVQTTAPAGATEVPKDWDGVTFKSIGDTITIVAPEKGWECTNQTETSLMLLKDDDTMSYIILEYDGDKKMLKEEDEIRSKLKKHNDIIEFSYDKDQDGVITYEYVTQSSEKTGLDILKYAHITIDGNTRTEATVTTQKGNDERLGTLRDSIKKSLSKNK